PDECCRLNGLKPPHEQSGPPQPATSTRPLAQLFPTGTFPVSCSSSKVARQQARSPAPPHAVCSDRGRQVPVATCPVPAPPHMQLPVQPETSMLVPLQLGVVCGLGANSPTPMQQARWSAPPQGA